MKESEYIACQNLAKLRAAESLIRDTYYEFAGDDRDIQKLVLVLLEDLTSRESKKFKLRDVE
jgi:hypothetical protein